LIAINKVNEEKYNILIIRLLQL